MTTTGAMTDTSPAIRISDVRKVYHAKKTGEAKEALKGINLEITRGSIFGLLGPNGAGKSTLINIMAGLTMKTSGTVDIWGYNIDEHPRQARASIGVVPQELSVDTFFTVREAIELHAGYYGVPKAQRRTQAIIDVLKLTPQADVNTRRLSGGMKRRLMVGKALVHNPPILILDEPTAGVDVELREQLWEYVRELNAQGVTILLTTHYLEEAEELCDNIAIINNGAVVACDSKTKLMGLFDRKQLLVTLERELPAIPAAFHAYDAKMDGEGRLVMDYKPSETRVDDLIGVLHKEGVAIRDLTTVQPALDDVFRHFTAGMR